MSGHARLDAGTRRRRKQPRVVAQVAEPEDPQEEPGSRRPHGPELRLRSRVQLPRSRRGQARHRSPHDELAALVARGLRSLRSVLHSYGVARRRYVPQAGRTRRCRSRHAALRAAEQLARQREPGQGPPSHLAGQAEVRPQTVLGRPHRAHRQRRHRVHGPADLRLRRRTRRRLGAGRGRLLGPRADLVGRRALPR